MNTDQKTVIAFWFKDMGETGVGPRRKAGPSAGEGDLLKDRCNFDLWIKDMAVEVAEEFSCDYRKCFFVRSLVFAELSKQFLVERVVLLQTPRNLEQNFSNVAVATL